MEINLFLFCIFLNRRGYHAVFFLTADKRRLESNTATFDLYYKTIFPDLANYFRIIYTQYVLFLLHCCFNILNSFQSPFPYLSSEYDMDYLHKNPDPLGRNVKGVCIGCKISPKVYEVTSARTLAVITECINFLLKNALFSKEFPSPSSSF